MNSHPQSLMRKPSAQALGDAKPAVARNGAPWDILPRNAQGSGAASRKRSAGTAPAGLVEGDRLVSRARDSDRPAMGARGGLACPPAGARRARQRVRGPEGIVGVVGQPSDQARAETGVASGNYPRAASPTHHAYDGGDLLARAVVGLAHGRVRLRRWQGRRLPANLAAADRRRRRAADHRLPRLRGTNLLRRRHSRDLQRRRRIEPERVRDADPGRPASPVEACGARRTALARRPVAGVHRARAARHHSTRGHCRWRRTRPGHGSLRHHVRHLVRGRAPSPGCGPSRPFGRSRLLGPAGRCRDAGRYRRSATGATTGLHRHLVIAVRVDRRFDLLLRSRAARPPRLAAAIVAGDVRGSRHARAHDTGPRFRVFSGGGAWPIELRRHTHRHERLVGRDRRRDRKSVWSASAPDARDWHRQSLQPFAKRPHAGLLRRENDPRRVARQRSGDRLRHDG